MEKDIFKKLREVKKVSCVLICIYFLEKGDAASLCYSVWSSLCLGPWGLPQPLGLEEPSFPSHPPWFAWRWRWTQERRRPIILNQSVWHLLCWAELSHQCGSYGQIAGATTTIANKKKNLEKKGCSSFQIVVKCCDIMFSQAMHNMQSNIKTRQYNNVKYILYRAHRWQQHRLCIEVVFTKSKEIKRPQHKLSQWEEQLLVEPSFLKQYFVISMTSHVVAPTILFFV